MNDHWKFVTLSPTDAELKRLDSLSREARWHKTFRTSDMGLPCVYFLQEAYIGMKIGYTTDILGRLTQIKKALRFCPALTMEAFDDTDTGEHFERMVLKPDVNVLAQAFTPNAYELEQLLHEIYAPDRLKSVSVPRDAAPTEWYEDMISSESKQPGLAKYVHIQIQKGRAV